MHRAITTLSLSWFIQSILIPFSIADAQVATDLVQGGVLDQQFVEDFTQPRYK
jgi:hypothetical protein